MMTSWTWPSRKPAEIDDLGLEDLVSGEGIVAIEWAERWKGHPDDVTEVSIKDLGEDSRAITIARPR
jgi:tRNA A37 threonylcarbamoyladenosine biosynthesis protein TsaE